MLSLDTQAKKKKAPPPRKKVFEKGEPLFQTLFFGEGERDRMLLRWKGEVSVTFNSMEDGVLFFISFTSHLQPLHTSPPLFFPPLVT